MTIYCPKCGTAVEITPKVKRIRTNHKGYLELEFESLVIGHACPIPPQDKDT
jgi:hypothetical protein